MEENSKECQFLHDIATPIAGLKLMIKRLHQSHSTGHPEMSSEQIIDRLGKCVELVERLEQLHSDFKSELERVRVA